jgi:iron(III) transport system ATP-binding protein
MTTLEIHGVSKSYGAVRAVHDVSLTVPQGCHTAIVGPSGSGKTTLLRLIAGFEAPDAGSIKLNDALLADGAGTFMPAHKRQIGYLPQDGALFPHLSVAANIAFSIAHEPAGVRQRRVDELAGMVALDRALLARYPHELSGGQQQRVGLARALAQRPKLILLDEPFSALDTGLRSATRKATIELLDASGVTALLVTHDQAEALSFSDQIAVMREGRIAQSGPPIDLYLRPRDAVTATFLGDAIIVPAHLAGNGWAACCLGSVPVDDAVRSGSASIMLRPEQVSVVNGSVAECGAQGQVVEVEFVGHSCILTVDVALDSRLQVRCPVGSAPRAGATVSLSVTGPAHVLR